MQSPVTFGEGTSISVSLFLLWLVPFKLTFDYIRMAFMPVPWAFSTAAALALVALSAGPGHMIVERLTNPANVAPAAASALLGTSGATLLLVVLFLAVTSAASAELVAVSSIVVYDIYKPSVLLYSEETRRVSYINQAYRYFNPHASEQTIVRVSP